VYVGLATNMANVAQAEVLVRATVGTNQSIPNNAYTKVQFDTETLDVYNEFNTSTNTFTAKRAGQYFITATFLFNTAAWATNAQILATIDKNGAQIMQNWYPIQGSYNNYTGVTVNQTIDLAVGDTIHIGVYQSSGAAKTLFASTSYSGMSISRFPSSSELVVKPETQNVWAGVTYSRTPDSITIGAGVVAPTGYVVYSDSAWNTGKVLYGKCQATDVDANRIGCKIPNLPVGAYKITATGLFYESSITAGNLICSHALYESTTNNFFSSSTNMFSNTQGGVLYNGRTLTGIFNNTAVGDRNFVIAGNKTFDTTSGASGNCQVFVSNTGGDISNFTIMIQPLDQPSNSALYVEGPVKAAATGAAIPAGYVGRTIHSTATIFPASGYSQSVVTTISVPPGVWIVQTHCKGRVVAPTLMEAAVDDSGSFLDINGQNTQAAFNYNSNTGDIADAVSSLAYHRITSTKTLGASCGRRFPTAGGVVDAYIKAIQLN